MDGQHGYSNTSAMLCYFAWGTWGTGAYCRITNVKIRITQSMWVNCTNGVIRSQAVAMTADRTASQQTIYELAIVAKLHLQLFSLSVWALRVLGSRLAWRDVIHVTIRFSIAISCWWSFGNKPLSRTVSEIFNGESDAKVDMSLNELYAKVKIEVIYFGANQFLTYDCL